MRKLLSYLHCKLDVHVLLLLFGLRWVHGNLTVTYYQKWSKIWHKKCISMESVSHLLPSSTCQEAVRSASEFQCRLSGVEATNPRASRFGAHSIRPQ